MESVLCRGTSIGSGRHCPLVSSLSDRVRRSTLVDLLRTSTSDDLFSYATSFRCVDGAL